MTAKIWSDGSGQGNWKAWSTLLAEGLPDTAIINATNGKVDRSPSEMAAFIEAGGIWIDNSGVPFSGSGPMIDAFTAALRIYPRKSYASEAVGGTAYGFQTTDLTKNIVGENGNRPIVTLMINGAAPPGFVGMADPAVQTTFIDGAKTYYTGFAFSYGKGFYAWAAEGYNTPAYSRFVQNMAAPTLSFREGSQVIIDLHLVNSAAPPIHINKITLSIQSEGVETAKWTADVAKDLPGSGALDLAMQITVPEPKQYTMTAYIDTIAGPLAYPASMLRVHAPLKFESAANLPPPRDTITAVKSAPDDMLNKGSLVQYLIDNKQTGIKRADITTTLVRRAYYPGPNGARLAAQYGANIGRWPSEAFDAMIQATLSNSNPWPIDVLGVSLSISERFIFPPLPVYDQDGNRIAPARGAEADGIKNIWARLRPLSKVAGYWTSPLRMQLANTGAQELILLWQDDTEYIPNVHHTKPDSQRIGYVEAYERIGVTLVRVDAPFADFNATVTLGLTNANPVPVYVDGGMTIGSSRAVTQGKTVQTYRPFTLAATKPGETPLAVEYAFSNVPMPTATGNDNLDIVMQWAGAYFRLSDLAFNVLAAPTVAVAA